MPPPAAGRTIVVGAGKAAATMAETLVARFGGPLAGVVVTRRGQGLPAGGALPQIDVREASHPLPDETSVAAAMRVLGCCAASNEGTA